MIALLMSVTLAGRVKAAGHPPAVGAYAVVVSRRSYGDKAWRPVVDALVAKYKAEVVRYNNSPGEARAALARLMPNYVCFVARPGEAGRAAVVGVHRLMRKLDADPYTDAIWGILTGYEAADALRIARHAKPLIVRRVLSGTTGVGLGPFETGEQYNEGKAGTMRLKTADGRIETRPCPTDTTELIVKAFNTGRVDCFFTSGHATPRDWQLGYRYRNGQLRCKGGQLYGLDLRKKRHDIRSPNPKVYLPVGNCLIGLIPDRECMALALMHTGGVYQMFGYTVLTWYGWGGWGVRDLFTGQAGRFTLAEAFYFNNQALVQRLESRFPKTARVNFERYDLERDRGLLGKLAARHGLLDKGTGKFRSREELGLLWDRDTVGFYGDPAWRAILPRRKLSWDQAFRVRGETVTFTVKTRGAGDWPKRPIAAFLPYRAADVKIIEGADLKPVIADNFILLPMRGKFAEAQTLKVVFRARKLQRSKTQPKS